MNLKTLAAAGSAIVSLAATAVAQVVPTGYDVTRTFTECTTGSANSCAALSFRTYGLSTGGTHVAIGLSNLQGTSLFDNLSGSLLTGAAFTMALSAGQSTTNGNLTGSPTGSAAGAPVENVSASGTRINLAAPSGNSSRTAYDVSVYNSYYQSCNNGYNVCGPYGYTTYPGYTVNTASSSGIAGAGNANRTVSANTTNTGATAQRAGASNFSYQCGTNSWGSALYCTGSQPNNYSVDAGVYNQQVTQQYSLGSTTGTSAYWFSFDSPNMYDARNVQYASFTGLTASGASLSCNPAIPGSCSIVSDVLEGGDIETTPEPASLVLLATGLIGVGLVHRRRKNLAD